MRDWKLSDLVEKVQAYLDREKSLRELTEFLAPQLPILFSFPEPAEADLAAAIELGRAEISAGDISEDQFRDELAEALREYHEAMSPTRWGWMGDRPITNTSAVPPNSDRQEVWFTRPFVWAFPST